MIQIINGDCRDVLKTLPDNSVHCVVTSPPYYNLRDYNVSGQIGLEDSPQQYVQTMVDVFRQVRRVLREDGVVFLNIGDTYAANRGHQVADNKHCHVGNTMPAKVPDGLKQKDLMMIPARVALALQADGWWLRSEITWCKKSAMPESVTDRPSNATEKVFLLTKSAKYFYDNIAVMEDSSTQEEHKPWKDKTYDQSFLANQQANGVKGRPHGVAGYVVPGKRNLRNFWLLGPDPFPGAHFATMPRKLVEPCILAGTSEKGCCSECGAPYQRIVESKRVMRHELPKEDFNYRPGRYTVKSNGQDDYAKGGGQAFKQSTSIGWKPACTCNAPAKPCVVLDPFGGSGTVGMVAEKLGRDAILIELNPDYIELAKQRTAQPGFSFLEAA